jgi:hypothetical protein
MSVLLSQYRRLNNFIQLSLLLMLFGSLSACETPHIELETDHQTTSLTLSTAIDATAVPTIVLPTPVRKSAVAAADW